MSVEQLIAKFLEEINSDCFPVNGGGNKKIREQAFLKKRFDPKNYEPKLIRHQEIAQQINKELNNENCQSAIGTTCQNVVRALVEQYGSEMTTDGIYVDCLVNGSKGQKGAWEIGYRWLYDKKFPRWLTQEKNRVWQAWKVEAKPDVAIISFKEISGICKAMTGKSRPKEQIYLNQDYSMEIQLKQDSDYYLLLLNRGQSCQGEETKYLVCPSPAFAPHLQAVTAQFTLPQPGAEFEMINFDEPGREEYLGILLKEKPDLPSFMTDTEENILPTWNESDIYKLWQEISKQEDYQVFYQSFEVVNS